MNKNNLGLNIERTNEVADLLNILLADHQIYYQNLRGFHWLVAGKDFYQLHELFEKLYDEASVTIDELAERVLMLGKIPFHTFEEYLTNANIKVAANLRKSDKIMENVALNVSSLLNSARNILNHAAENNDSGTVALLDDLISGYEKHLWMFSTYSLNID